MNHLTRHLPPLAHLALLLSLALTSCGSGNEVVITDTRTLSEDEREPRLDATSEERFRLALTMAGFGPQAPPKRRAGQPQLAWDTPPSWEAVEGNPMRQVDLRFGKQGQGECYVMRAGGSLADNVNRWRRQMGLPSIPDEEIAELPRRKLFGMDAYLVMLDGDYAGVGASESQKGYRMMGVILPFADVSLFVKMIGPKSQVLRNEDEFHAFCDSLRIETS